MKKIASKSYIEKLASNYNFIFKKWQQNGSLNPKQSDELKDLVSRFEKIKTNYQNNPFESPISLDIGTYKTFDEFKMQVNKTPHISNRQIKNLNKTEKKPEVEEAKDKAFRLLDSIRRQKAILYVGGDVNKIVENIYYRYIELLSYCAEIANKYNSNKNGSFNIQEFMSNNTSECIKAIQSMIKEQKSIGNDNNVEKLLVLKNAMYQHHIIFIRNNQG